MTGPISERCRALVTKGYQVKRDWILQAPATKVRRAFKAKRYFFLEPEVASEEE